MKGNERCRPPKQPHIPKAPTPVMRDQVGHMGRAYTKEKKESIFFVLEYFMNTFNMSFDEAKRHTSEAISMELIIPQLYMLSCHVHNLLQKYHSPGSSK